MMLILKFTQYYICDYNIYCLFEHSMHRNCVSENQILHFQLQVKMFWVLTNLMRQRSLGCLWSDAFTQILSLFSGAQCWGESSGDVGSTFWFFFRRPPFSWSSSLPISIAGSILCQDPKHSHSYHPRIPVFSWLLHLLILLGLAPNWESIILVFFFVHMFKLLQFFS